MIEEELKKKVKSTTFRISFSFAKIQLQNIDLMNLGGFCRNCLSKWMVEETKK